MSRGMKFIKGLDSHSEMSYENASDAIEEKTSESERLKKAGAELVADKEKVENELDRIRTSTGDEEVKKRLEKYLTEEIEKVQRRYVQEIAEAQEKLHEEIQDVLQVVKDNLENLIKTQEQMDTLKKDAPSVDLSTAENEVESKKKDYEALHRESVQKLQLQMDSAARQQREMFRRRISGR